MRASLRRPSPTWPEVVDAPDWLRHDLDVSKPLWGEVCLAMGREGAAIALAVVSTTGRAVSSSSAPASTAVGGDGQGAEAASE